MKSIWVYISIVLISLVTAMTFQNCGNKQLQLGSNDNGDLTVDLDPDDEDDSDTDGEDDDDGDDDDNSGGGDGGGNGGGGTGTFKFDLNNGDIITYQSQSPSDSTPELSRVLVKGFNILQETTLFSPGTPQALPTEYCKDSALPHCIAQSLSSCASENCPELLPVRCHWQSRLSSSAIDSILNNIRALKFVTRGAHMGEVQDGCNHPLLHFTADNQTTSISLASQQCVPNGSYLASSGGQPIIDQFEQRLDQVAAQSPCNLFSSYNWSTTNFVYTSQSAGNVVGSNMEMRHIEYSQQKANVRYRLQGDTRTFCKENVFVNPPEIDAFFPDAGLKYSVIYPQGNADVHPKGMITYKESTDNGLQWPFYLNELHLTHDGGGALLPQANVQAIQAAVEVIIDRARNTTPLPTLCP